MEVRKKNGFLSFEVNIFICWRVLPAWLNVHHVSAVATEATEATRGQWSPLEPELQKVVSSHVGANN